MEQLKEDVYRLIFNSQPPYLSTVDIHAKLKGHDISMEELNKFLWYGIEGVRVYREKIDTDGAGNARYTDVLYFCPNKYSNPKLYEHLCAKYRR